MDAVRRYVFPVIWMLILGVIAAALVKMAFFPDAASTDGDDGQAPSASIDQYATVPVTKGDISSTLDLQGRVKADAGKSVLATTAGEINKIWVENGDSVGKGDPILQVKVAADPAPVAETPAPAPAPASPAPSSAPSAPPPAPAPAPVAPETRFTYHTLRASGSGTVRDLKAVMGQTVSVGDQVASLSPGTYAVVADLTPEQQLTLLDRDVTATATLPGTSAPIRCASTGIEEDGEDDKPEQPAAPQIDPNTGMPMEAPTSVAALRCAVPEKTKVVPGLSVTVGVDLGSATGVLTVPKTAVVGTLSQGAVYLPDDNGGEPKKHPVKLGLRGDDVVQIVSGLKENQEVLQFVPGVDNAEVGGGMPGGDMPEGPGW